MLKSNEIWNEIHYINSFSDGVKNWALLSFSINVDHPENYVAGSPLCKTENFKSLFFYVTICDNSFKSNKLLCTLEKSWYQKSMFL